MTEAQLVWLERRLFEVVGGWVPTTPEPEVKLLFRRDSFRHAAHAGRWGVPAAAEPSPALAVVVAAVAAPVTTAERLAGMYAVLLPWLVSNHGDRLPAGVVADDEVAIREGQAALERLGRNQAAQTQRTAVEALLAGSGL